MSSPLLVPSSFSFSFPFLFSLFLFFFSLFLNHMFIVHTHKLTIIHLQSHRSTIIYSLTIIHPHQDLHEHINNHNNTSRITRIYQESQKYKSIIDEKEVRKEEHMNRIRALPTLAPSPRRPTSRDAPGRTAGCRPPSLGRVAPARARSWLPPGWLHHLCCPSASCAGEEAELEKRREEKRREEEDKEE
jgi:hypothetical protein